MNGVIENRNYVPVEKMKPLLQRAIVTLDRLWCHHQDGSDLLVDEHELFDVVFNSVLKDLRKVNKALHDQEMNKHDYTYDCEVCGLNRKESCTCIKIKTNVKRSIQHSTGLGTAD